MVEVRSPPLSYDIILHHINDLRSEVRVLGSAVEDKNTLTFTPDNFKSYITPTITNVCCVVYYFMTIITTTITSCRTREKRSFRFPVSFHEWKIDNKDDFWLFEVFEVKSLSHVLNKRQNIWLKPKDNEVLKWKIATASGTSMKKRKRFDWKVAD